jgi:alpha-beta hydrolase superfamily lysophospholipase
LQRRAFLAALPPLLAACTPVAQVAGSPGLDFAGPRLESDRFISFDGARLGLTVWPAVGEPSAVIVALHGMNDYAQAFTLAAPIWAEEGITTYAIDQRGFGRSPRRGVWGGEALMTEDLRALTRVVRGRHPGALLTVVGESMGGAVAISAFASDRPPDADRLVLLSPAVWGWDAQPLLYRSTLWLGARTIPSYRFGTPRWVAREIRASDNIEHMIRMGQDRNLIFDTRVDAIYGLVNLMQRALVSVRSIRRPPPVLYCYGANDEIIPKKPSFFAARQLQPGDRSAYYRRGWHMLTRDLQGEAVTRDVAAFIRDPAGPLPSGAPPIPGSRTPGAAGRATA